MAGILFNATTSKLEHTTTSGFDQATFTMLAWARAAGQGEGSFGRIFAADEASAPASGMFLSHQNAANVLLFSYPWSLSGGGAGQWTFSATDGQWNPVALSYDRTSTLNTPVARVGFAAATVTLLGAALGVAGALATGYCIGNRNAQDRTWDGGLMHLQFHPGILSAADMDKALRYPGSVRTNGAFWWPMLNGTYTRVLTANGTVWAGGTAPTATALATFTTNSPGCVPLDAHLPLVA